MRTLILNRVQCFHPSCTFIRETESAQLLHIGGVEAELTLFPSREFIKQDLFLHAIERHMSKQNFLALTKSNALSQPDNFFGLDAMS